MRVVATFGDDARSNAETLELAASVARARFAFPERARDDEEEGERNDVDAREDDGDGASASTRMANARTERFTLCLTRTDARDGRRASRRRWTRGVGGAESKTVV